MDAGHGVFLDLGSIDRGDLDLGRLRRSCQSWDLHPVTAPHEVAGRIAGARVVVTNKVVLDAERLGAAPGLRLVCVAATGTNNIDLDAAAALGIGVRNVRGYATASVVQHVLDLEPPPPDHPLLAPDIPNLTLTPHVAWASRVARQRPLDAVAANIEAFFEASFRAVSEPLNPPGSGPP